MPDKKRTPVNQMTERLSNVCKGYSCHYSN
jgi:hypothetical protein